MRFPFLSIIVAGLYVVAAACFIVGVKLLDSTAMPFCLVPFGLGVVIAAHGELLRLLLAIEENTRPARAPAEPEPPRVSSSGTVLGGL